MNDINTYITKIVFALGGLAGVTMIYFTIMIYYKIQIYKEEKTQTKLLLAVNKKIDEVFDSDF